MKTKVTITKDETKITCDHCGAEVVYSGSFCIVCGRHFCSTCYATKVNCIDLCSSVGLPKFPKFYPFNVGIQTFHAYACKACSNKITRRVAEIGKLTQERNENCRQWYEWHRDALRELNEWKEKAEAKFEKP